MSEAEASGASEAAAAAREGRLGRLIPAAAEPSGALTPRPSDVAAPADSEEDEEEEEEDEEEEEEEVDLFDTVRTVWDKPDDHLFGRVSLVVPSGQQPALQTALSDADSEEDDVELFSHPSPPPPPDKPAAPGAAAAPATATATATTASAVILSSSAAPAPEPQLRASQLPTVGAVDMSPLVRLAWMWQEKGHDPANATWVRRLVTLDTHGTFCIFTSDRMTQPEVRVRREDCTLRPPRTRRVEHPYAFRVDSSEQRADGLYVYKFVLAPCDSPEEEVATWMTALHIDRSRCDDTLADERRKAEGSWKSDGDRKDCARCVSGFGMLTRRHHCRICGDVYCGPCSETRRNMPLGGYKTAQRVCGQCLGQKEQEMTVQTQLLTGGRLLACGAFEKAIEAFELGVTALPDPTDERLMALTAGLQAAVSAKIIQDESRAFGEEMRAEGKRLLETREYIGAITAYDAALDRGSQMNDPTMVAGLEQALTDAVAAKLAQEEAVYAATTAFKMGEKLLTASRGVQEGVDVLSSEYIWQEYTEAIAAFRAALSEDTGDVSLTERLQQALQAAQAEAAHLGARKKLRAGDEMLTGNFFAEAVDAFKTGLALEQTVRNADGTPTALEGKLQEKVAVVQLGERHARASSAATTADHQIEQGDFVKAVEKITGALALEIGDPALTTRLERSLVSARIEAAKVAGEKLAHGERMLGISAWEDAHSLLSAGLGLVPALGEDSVEVAGALNEAMRYVEATIDCAQGEKQLAAKAYEAATSAFRQGLERGQRRDATLTERLTKGEADAAAGKKAQEDARERAKALLDEAKGLASDDGTLESAIEKFAAGVALRSAINGGLGFTLGVPNPMEICMAQLEKGLAETQSAKLSRDEARAAAHFRLVEGSRLMEGVSPRMSIVIGCFEQGLQQVRGDTTLNAQLEAALNEAKDRATKAADGAAGHLAEGSRLMTGREFEAAVVAFQKGVALRAAAAGASQLMEELCMGIGDAERGLAMRETSRKTAERLLTEGEKLVVAKDYTTAVAAFRDALLEQTDDDDLTQELQECLTVAEDALQLHAEVCQEARQLEVQANELAGQKQWTQAIYTFRAALVLCEKAAEVNLERSVQVGLDATLAEEANAEAEKKAQDEAATEAAQGYLTQGKRLCLPPRSDFDAAKKAFKQGLAEMDLVDKDTEFSQSLRKEVVEALTQFETDAGAGMRASQMDVAALVEAERAAAAESVAEPELEPEPLPEPEPLGCDGVAAFMAAAAAKAEAEETSAVAVSAPKPEPELLEPEPAPEAPEDADAAAARAQAREILARAEEREAREAERLVEAQRLSFASSFDDDSSDDGGI